ncbi:MAG TPA: hypothetical protein VK638_37125, partial [Edaphobacter sp.]|nr:hypothetical protein [Edaphobacter sp.]
RGGEQSGDMLIPRGGASTMQFIVGEKIHIGMDLPFERRGCHFCFCGVEGVGRFLSGDPKKTEKRCGAEVSAFICGHAGDYR